MALSGATLRQVVYDFITSFKQNYDDADITPYHMAYWVLIHADRLRKQHIEKRDSGEYVVLFDATVSTDSDGRKYITLPARIYDMDGDKAIDFISYDKLVGKDTPTYAERTFSRTTPSTMKRLYYSDDEKPSSDNPYFYRVGDLVYFIGVESLTLTTVVVGLITTLNPASTTLDLDQPFDFPQDLLPILERQILDLGFAALMVPRDLNNDGTGESAQQRVPRKMVSVNDFDMNKDGQ